MSLGYDSPLYILAFDHRTSFQQRLFGIEREPTPEQRRQMADAKLAILDGLEAVTRGASADTAKALGALVDEEHGAAAADAARERGLVLAVCAEKSSREEFELEFGDDYAAHIQLFDPHFVKVLVRWNPDGDVAMNARQAARLAELSAWLAPRREKLLFELIVPPSDAQLSTADGDAARFASELRPALVVETIGQLQAAGVEPDVWKVEGLDSVEDCNAVSAAARADGRDAVGCVVLGAGADDETVSGWLRAAAQADGFIGFAIGRTIFWNPLKRWIAGECDRDAAVEAIAANYRRMIDVYDAGRTPIAHR
ncbi:MAG TPA: DUF2090 domain-containing protein [Conexibacter sp.]|jgi:myo-inositol catabolism protein IolC|nr:DUF2090 domain-containing protein [Conexibacter sp.]